MDKSTIVLGAYQEGIDAYYMGLGSVNPYRKAQKSLTDRESIGLLQKASVQWDKGFLEGFNRNKERAVG